MSYYRSGRRDYSEYKYVKYSDSKWKDKKPTYADFGLQESEIDRILQAHREIDEMSEFSLSDDLLALKRKYESRSAIVN